MSQIIDKELNDLIDNIHYKKSVLDKNQPLPREIIQNLGDWLRIELTYTSNAIEGNTLSRQETILIVDENLSIPGKSINEILEAINHNKALQLVQTLSNKKSINEINQGDFLDIHRIILQSIDDHNAGSYRNVPVRIQGSEHIPPNHIKVSEKMDEIEKWLHTCKDDPIKIASDLHYEVVSVHPFIDGNGRTSRLLFNLVLLIAGYPLSFITTIERPKYLSSLESYQTGGNGVEYCKIMFKSIERSLDMYINAVQNTMDTKNSTNKELYKVGELANITGESTITIRYWTKMGLLPIVKKGQGKYAYYDTRSIALINKIKQLQTNKRYTLEEIKKILNP